MRNISSVILDKLKSSEYIVALCLKMSISEHCLRYSTWSTNIAVDEDPGEFTYSPRGFSFDSINYGSSSVVDSVRLRIDDVDRSLYSTYGNVSVSDGNATEIRLAVLDDIGEVISSSLVFSGSVSEWDYSPAEFNCTVSSIFVSWASITLSSFSGSCRWKVFKGSECKHAGVESDCNRTYTQCSNYGNTDNFGGFRWLQDLEAKADDEVKAINMSYFRGRR